MSLEKKNSTLQAVTSPLDYVSFFAYEKHQLRQSMWKEDFTHFFPLYISKRHGHAAIPYFKHCISEIYGRKVQKNVVETKQILVCSLFGFGFAEQINE